MKITAMRLLFQKFSQLNWFLILLVLLISGMGWGLLISAGGGDPHIWALKQK